MSERWKVAESTTYPERKQLVKYTIVVEADYRELAVLYDTIVAYRVVAEHNASLKERLG